MGPLKAPTCVTASPRPITGHSNPPAPALAWISSAEQDGSLLASISTTTETLRLALKLQLVTAQRKGEIIELASEEAAVPAEPD